MNKYLCLLALPVLMLSSCETLTKTAKTADVEASLQSVVVADLNVADHRVTSTMDVTPSVRRGGFKNIKQAVEAKALEENGNADILLEPQYVVEKKRNLFGSKVTRITVSGRPASYKDFRALNDSVWCNPVFRGVKGYYRKSSVNNAARPTAAVKPTGTAGPFRKAGWAGYLNISGGWAYQKLTDPAEFDIYDDEFNIGAQISVGYQFSPYWFVGIGSGINYMDNENGFVVPLFAQVRLNLFNKKCTPFVDYKIGGLVATSGMQLGEETNVSGGFYNAISVGYSFGNVDLAFTYHKQNIGREFHNYWMSDETLDCSLKNVNISIGFRF